MGRLFRNMNTGKYYFMMLKTVIIMSVFLLISCEKEPVNTDTVSSDIKSINMWIKNNMEALYYWNEKIPEDLDPGQENDPEAYFFKMIYVPEDKWSYITSDFPSLLAELQGTPLSTGISPAFVRIGPEQIVLIVEFVYKGSPAYSAGIKRGDMIISIDGELMNLSNYNELYNRNSFTAGLGKMEGNTIVPTGESFSLESVIIEADPLLHHDILDVNGIKTGYMVYSGFRSGTNDRFINTLDQALSNFKTNGISELIVDLRYNRGGEIDVAGYLASGIAPQNVLDNDILIRTQYNEGLTDYLKKEYGDDSRYLVLKFPLNDFNLNLSRVYFLTGWKTASASELIITGLDPYMQVVSIGDTTVGKYTGSWVLSDTNNPPKHNYGMMPIVLKYANALGYTDFKNGLAPDYRVDEFILDLRPFGDPGDPLLGKAKELIGGIIAVKKQTVVSVQYTCIDDKKNRERSILLFPSPDNMTPDIEK